MRATKAISLMMLLFVFISIFAACQKEQTKDNPQELAYEIKTFADSDIEWIELKEDEISNYFAFYKKGVAEASVLLDKDDIKNNMIAVFSFQENGELSTAIEAIDKSLANDPGAQGDSTSDQSEKLKNRIVMKKGKTIVIAVLSDTEKLREDLKEKGYK